MLSILLQELKVATVFGNKYTYHQQSSFLKALLPLYNANIELLPIPGILSLQLTISK